MNLAQLQHEAKSLVVEADKLASKDQPNRLDYELAQNYLNNIINSLDCEIPKDERLKQSESFSHFNARRMEEVNMAYSEKLAKLHFQYRLHYDLIDEDLLKIMKNTSNQ